MGIGGIVPLSAIDAPICGEMLPLLLNR